MKGILGLIGALVFACTAHAEEVLYYQGAPVTVTLLSGAPDDDPPTNIGPMSGEVTLSTPLAANGTQTVTPASFNFQSASGLLNSTWFAEGNQLIGPDSEVGQFTFTTVNGAITGWDVNLSAIQGLGHAVLSESLSSTVQGDTYTNSIFQSACDFVPDGGCYTVQAQSNTPGQWTPSPVPLPSSALLMLSGLFGLSLFFRNATTTPA
jgi:hypothetical protein